MYKDDKFIYPNELLETLFKLYINIERKVERPTVKIFTIILAVITTFNYVCLDFVNEIKPERALL